VAEATGIEWTDHTFNPWWGCEKVSPGCAHCYAERVSNRYEGPGLWGAGHRFRFFGDAHWDEPLRWNARAERDGVRRRVFCASMADVFEERPELREHRYRLFALISATPHLDWQILTKRPEHALDLLTSPWWWAKVEGTAQRIHEARTGADPSEWLAVHGPLPNVWLGVSIENARFTWRADVLRAIPAAVRFLSCEPLLGSLFPESFECPRCEGQRYDVGSCSLCANRGRLDDRGSRDRMPLDLTGIDWVIVGGESGRGARPMHPDWAREIRDACLALCPSCSGTGRVVSAHDGLVPHRYQGPCSCAPGRQWFGRPAFFFKQWGEHDAEGQRVGKKAAGRDLDGRTWDEFPATAAVPA
jgi:protein gp37